MSRFVRYTTIVFIVIILTAAGYRFVASGASNSVITPIVRVIERPLDAYTIDALAERGGKSDTIVLDEPVATGSSYTVAPFHFRSEGKLVTGLAHIPNDATQETKKPVVVQIRGYVDHDIYAPGVGTKRSAEVFAGNGYISLAPDYLGYGGSDNPSSDVFEERFRTYTVTMDLLASVRTLPMADATKIGIRAHSNGGQIALTTLEATGFPYPTTLWAPVTAVFPYSILYYTDEAPDHGKALRKKLSEFERTYDTDRFAMNNFTDRITAPIQLHQGTADEAVPVSWSVSFVKNLKEHGKTVTYFEYPGADHNLQPSWNAVVSRDLEFFNRTLR